ncbi:MAG: aminodeoxychorismate synthase component I [Cytophagales bacterium]|nr:aminodeoxychorismate synthase component I [Bernardetiaceae bacterium]MDW8211496.1 aminodeoxychorismate synthase component I [Cytophagales bacterium]
MNVSRWQAIELMNQYGAGHTPFLFVIDYLMQKNIVLPLQEVQPDEILYQIGTFTNSDKPKNSAAISKSLQIVKFPICFQEYLSKFEQVMSQIVQGNTYLLNLTCPTPIECNFSLQEIFHISRARYKIWVRDQFVCFSPETFVKIENQRIFSCPMKGTIDACIPDAKEIIMSDEKETAEHYTIVDLIRNDLSMVAKKVRVEKFRYTDLIHAHDKTLLQVSSCIAGQLPRQYCAHLGEILFRLLPAGSISGAPKAKTVEIIEKVEGYPRGYYTGIFGIFDGYHLDSAVAIRFIEQTPTGLVFKSGGGITCHSLAEREYNEMLQKVYVPIA